MAFYGGFNGDYKSLETILRTLRAKSYMVPGWIVNPRTQVSVKGEIAYMFIDAKPTAAGSHNLGTALSYTVKGVTRKNIDLANGVAIAAVIPQANIHTVSAPVVDEYIVSEAIKATNIINEAFVTDVGTAAEAKTYTKDATPFAAILEGIGDFKVDNKVSGGRPTGGFISSSFKGELLNDNKYIRSTKESDMLAFGRQRAELALEKEEDPIKRIALLPSQRELFDGEVFWVAGVPFIEVPDLASVDFVLFNAEGVAHVENVFSLAIADGTAAGHPNGVIIAGEIGVGNLILTKSDAPNLDSSTGYFVTKYTEASS